MPQLTRKCVNDRPVTWHIHYAGVRVGVIVERSGAPPSSDQWQWCCGFYPGSNPGDDRHGTAASPNLTIVDQAAIKTGFDFRRYLATCTARALASSVPCGQEHEPDGFRDVPPGQGGAAGQFPDLGSPLKSP